MEHQMVRRREPQREEERRPNLTGIPTQMKLDYERRSGLSFDDVRVHYHSDRPAKVGALAYTQGTQVHIGPGQERHLGHELGHVIQQKRGLVPATRHVAGLPVNDDLVLERQADHAVPGGRFDAVPVPMAPAGGTIQRKIWIDGEEWEIN